MSANNRLVILKNKKGEFEIHIDSCVDNEFFPNHNSLLTKESCLIDAIKPSCNCIK